MHLLIDAGNTRIKWAAVAPASAPGAWLDSGAVRHDALDSLEPAWRALAPVTHILIANVAGQAVRDAVLAVLARALPGCTPDWFASEAQLAGVRNGYRNPRQLGCDRFAAAIGARALFADRALIIATCGTATTIDALDADGLFAGGLILPGLNLMAQALYAGTAQLPQIDWDRVGGAAAAFPDNTDDAIARGCLAAQCGAIRAAFEQQAARQPGVLCLLSGGAAPVIAHALCMPYQIVDNLVLNGLQATLRAAPPPIP